MDLPPGTRFGVVISHDVDHLGLREHLVESRVDHLDDALEVFIGYGRRLQDVRAL